MTGVGELVAVEAADAGVIAAIAALDGVVILGVEVAVAQEVETGAEIPAGRRVATRETSPVSCLRMTDWSTSSLAKTTLASISANTKIFPWRRRVRTSHPTLIHTTSAR